MASDGSTFQWKGNKLSKLDFILQNSISTEFKFLPEDLQGSFESVALYAYA